MAAAKVISRLGATPAGGSEAAAVGSSNADHEAGIRAYYLSKIDELELVVRERTQNLQRLKAQRNEWNAKGTFGLWSAVLGDVVVVVCVLMMAPCLPACLLT